MFEITDTQKQIRDAAAKLAGTVIQPRAADVDKTEEYPWHNVKALTEAGASRILSPEPMPGVTLTPLKTDLDREAAEQELCQRAQQEDFHS